MESGIYSTDLFGIKEGVDINEKDFEGKTALMIYILKNISETKKESAIKILIENGANLDAKNFEGMTALMLHVDKNKSNQKSANFINTFAQNGASLDAKNFEGMTALMLATKSDKYEFVKALIDNGADANIGWAVEDMAKGRTKELFKKFYHPQDLVKLLKNFTIDKPIKYTTHTWDFGELQKEYENFDGYMSAVKNQFEEMKNELERLSPNLYKKVYTFLLESAPRDDYSWCNKAYVNIGWSSLDGLKEWCDSGNNPFDYKLKKSIMIPPRKQLSTFSDIINLFKQEIEIRADFNNLETIIKAQNINIDLSSAKLSNRQFYTDTEKLTYALDKIFGEIKKREAYPNIEVTATELEDRSIEIKITQIDSPSSRSVDELLQRAKQSGDLSDIVQNLQNLCDYSIEASYEDTNFRVTFLHSNNVKDKETLEERPRGFTHILRFYK